MFIRNKLNRSGSTGVVLTKSGHTYEVHTYEVVRPQGSPQQSTHYSPRSSTTAKQ